MQCCARRVASVYMIGSLRAASVKKLCINISVYSSKVMFSLVMDYLVGTLQGIALVGIITVLTVVRFL